MRFLAVQYKTSNNPSAPPSAQAMAEMGKLGAEATAAGALLITAGLIPNGPSVRIRLKDGKRTLTDGPFTEAKELVGGVAVYQVKTREEAVEWASRFAKLAGDDIEVELLPLFDPADFKR